MLFDLFFFSPPTLISGAIKGPSWAHLKRSSKNMFADWNPTCLSCLLQLNANADHLNGLSSCQDAARSSVADHRNTNSPLERWRSQERTAAAHGQNEPYSTTGFYLWLHWSKEWRERSKSFVLVKPPSPLSRPHFPPLSSLCFIANKKQKFMFCFFFYEELAQYARASARLQSSSCINIQLARPAITP